MRVKEFRVMGGFGIEAYTEVRVIDLPKDTELDPVFQTEVDKNTPLSDWEKAN